MIKPKIGFVVYGVHKDGLQDPMGQPFIDDTVVANAKKALQAAGAELVVEDLVIASKREARACFSKFKKMDDLDAIVLFSGTWVWAAHLIAPLGGSIWSVPYHLSTLTCPYAPAHQLIPRQPGPNLKSSFPKAFC